MKPTLVLIDLLSLKLNPAFDDSVVGRAVPGVSSAWSDVVVRTRDGDAELTRYRGDGLRYSERGLELANPLEVERMPLRFPAAPGEYLKTCARDPWASLAAALAPAKWTFDYSPIGVTCELCGRWFWHHEHVRREVWHADRELSVRCCPGCGGCRGFDLEYERLGAALLEHGELMS